jgi:RES domain-containing protein
VAADPLTLLPAGSSTEFVAFRYADYDTPFWVRSNTMAGRWNLAGQRPTQYWALSSDAAWAELMRSEELRTEADVELVRMPLWACRIGVSLIVDLNDQRRRDEFGITEEKLVSDDWTACQLLAPTLQQQFMGVIAPCAALLGHSNVTLFGARRAIEWISQPKLASAIRTSKVAIGRPPSSLIGRVQHRPPPESTPGRLFSVP